MNEIIWIYEYKDADTPIGATFFKGHWSDLPDEMSLPHLSSDWHWKIDTLHEE